MKQENSDRRKTFLPDVEDVQRCCFAFECAHNQSVSKSAEKKSKEDQSVESTKDVGTKDPKSHPEASQIFSPGASILQRILGVIKKQRNVDIESLYKGEYKIMKDDLKIYANQEDSSDEYIHKILEEIDDELRVVFGQISYNPEKPTDAQKSATKNPTTKFIEILHKEKKDSIVNILNSLLDIKKFNVSHFVVLSRTVEEICYGETLLHKALKFSNTIEFAEMFINSYPELLQKDRDVIGSVGFEGQTPFHVAIVKGSLKAVRSILKIAEKTKTVPELLNKSATGYKFRNTVLMGQLPLSVAALACKDKNFQIMETLVDKGAAIWKKNNDGDTVFHSLIKYADIYPNRMADIQASFEFLWGKVSHSGTIDIRYLENKSNLTPLHLSAQLGVSQLFDFIVNLQDVYCFTNIQDGLFDIREYDVTEFDRLIDHKENFQNAQKLTILESLFDSKCTHKEAFEILNQEIIEFILYKKWLAYRIPLFIWMILHFIFMTLFTAFAINKAELLFCFQNNETLCEIGVGFIAVIVINVIFGLIYFTFAVVCIIKLIDRCTKGPEINFGLMYHNLDYLVCLFVVSIGTMAEAVLIFLKIHWDYHLAFALISGWYFMLYFSPFSKNLVSFTHMIKKGFLEDFVPFGLVFLYLLVSFTGVMHVLFLGIDDEVLEFNTFQNSLLTMFNLGVGLSNIEVLGQARVPWLAYTLFVVFTIFSFIHLFNALVAVMSQTFSDVHTDKHSYLKYNRLRMIELFEDIVLIKIFTCSSFLDKAKHWKTPENDENEEDPPDGENSIAKNDEIDLNHENIGEENKTDKRRYYSVLHLLDDPNDDISEKEEKKKEPGSKLRDIFKKLTQGHHQKDSTLKRSRKTNPSTEITYVQVEMRNEASQCPE